MTSEEEAPKPAAQTTMDTTSNPGSFTCDLADGDDMAGEPVQSQSRKNNYTKRSTARHIDEGSVHERLIKSDEIDSNFSAPHDKYRLICIGFAILGITTLLPWNFFITATDYWMYKFRNVSQDSEHNPAVSSQTQRTPLQTFFESYLAIAANFPLIVAMSLNSLYGQRYSPRKRLFVSFSIILTIFILTTSLVRINTDNYQTLFFTFTIVSVIIMNFFSAILQASIFGIVASFPEHCMHSMVNAQALTGIIAVGLQVLSMWNNTEPLSSGLWYFLISTAFIAFSIVCYWLMDNEYTRYYLTKVAEEDQISTTLSIDIRENKSELRETIKDCWQLALSVMLNFWATLSVFPGVCVLILPEHPNTSLFTGRFYTPLTTFLLFACGDLAGRVCSTCLTFPASRKNTLLTLTIIRAIFPLMIVFCNVHPRFHSPTLFKNDLFFPILNVMTALTNGYVFSSAMVMASAGSPKDRLELTGFVMATALGIGLTLGSIGSNLILRVL